MAKPIPVNELKEVRDLTKQLDGLSGKVGKNFDDIPIKRGKSAFFPTTLDDYEIVNSGQSPMEVICCYPPTVEN